MKVLIAEDERNIANGIASILHTREEYKCQIRIAENGQEAYAAASAFRPDLVITDIRMQPMTGLELAQRLQQEKICNNIIIISGYSNFEYAQTAIRCSVMDYLLKPIDKGQLLELADKVWKALPQNYAAAAMDKLLTDIPFFSLDLEKDTYPGSLKKTLAYLRQNYMKDISLQTLSDELMLHPSYISTLIHKHTEVSFNHLLDYIRLEKACLLLLTEPDMTITEISYLVGYNNERRLYHAFQKQLGCTPGDFKKKLPEVTVPRSGSRDTAREP